MLTLVVVGFLLSTSTLKIKGLLVPFFVLLPNVVLIRWENPMSLIPVGIMTLVLGSGAGI